MKTQKSIKSVFIFIVGGLLYCSIFDIFTLNKTAYAYTCYSNESIEYACEHYSAITPRGTMWINGSPDGTDGSATYTATSLGTATVYIHGSIMGGSSASAHYIRFSKGPDRIEKTFDDSTIYAPLTSVPDYASNRLYGSIQ